MARDLPAMLREMAVRRSLPFAWGSAANDCASYANAVLRAETGRDLLSELGLSWSSEAEARAIFEATPIEILIGRVLAPVAPSLARRGDLGGVLLGTDLLLVIVEGDTLAGPGETATRRLPRRLLSKAWSAE